MDKKNIMGIIIVIILGAIMTMAKNNNQQPITNVISKTKNKTQALDVKSSVDKIEIYYFHRTQRCYSCNALSQYVKETIEQRFSEEIKSGKIEYREVNVDLPENKNVALKFQASGSSLFINTIKNGQDNINQDTNAWRLLSNKSRFQTYLENKINSLLGK